MPVRKPRVVKTQVDDSPVVFFLKITENDESRIIPAGDSTSYSDILNTEFSQNNERFNLEEAGKKLIEVLEKNLPVFEKKVAITLPKFKKITPTAPVTG